MAEVVAGRPVTKDNIMESDTRKLFTEREIM